MRIFLTLIGFGFLSACGAIVTENGGVIDTRCDVDDCSAALGSSTNSGAKTPEPTVKKPIPIPGKVLPKPVIPKPTVVTFAINAPEKALTLESNVVSWEKKDRFKSFNVYVDNEPSCETPSEAFLGVSEESRALDLTKLGYGPKYYVCVEGIDADGKTSDASNSPIEFKVSNVWVQRMSQTPAARAGASAVWADDKYMIWGGWDGHNALNDGHIYDPKTDTWRAMNMVGAPSARYRHFAFWTGEYILIYGGQDKYGSAKSDHHKYHVKTDTWESISNVGAPLNQFAGAAVWTGETGDSLTRNRMIVWSGMSCATCQLQSVGGVYNFETNSWTPTSSVNVPSPRSFPNFSFVDGKMLISGGGNYNGTGRSDSHAYDLKANTWSNLPASGMVARYSGTDALIGDHFIVWGGAYSRTTTDYRFYNDGVKYNYKTNSFSALPLLNSPAARTGAGRAVIGNKFVLFGGQTITPSYEILPVEDGAVYDLDSSTWRKVSSLNAPPATYGVWGHGVSTGEAFIYWSGNKGSGKSYSQEGGIYIP